MNKCVEDEELEHFPVLMGGTLPHESSEDEGLLDQDTIEDPSQSATKENSSIEKEPLQKPVF